MTPVTWVACALFIAANPYEVVDNSAPVNGGIAQSLNYEAWWNHPLTQDFWNAANPFAPLKFETEPRYFDPYGWQMANTPFRLGLMGYNDVFVVPTVQTTGSANGRFGLIEADSWVRYPFYLQPDVLLNLTGNWNAVYWNGPGSPRLAAQAELYSLDLETVFLGNGPWTTSFAFHPQIVTDYEHPLTRHGFNFDGRAVSMYRASPEWLYVMGIAFWDRVDLFVIPEVGAVWTPNANWEVRLLFPRSRVNFRICQTPESQTWVYGGLEFTVDSYQVDSQNLAGSDRVQFRNWEAVWGIRNDRSRATWMLEAGIIFARRVSFESATPAFNVHSTGIFRVGLWF